MNRLYVFVVIGITSIFLVGCGQVAPHATSEEASHTNTLINSGASYTMDEVSVHNSSRSCRTVIDGKVYDLTHAIEAHPGGPEAILRLCGKDGTAQFTKKHGGQGGPEEGLAQNYIGDLVE